MNGGNEIPDNVLGIMRHGGEGVPREGERVRVERGEGSLVCKRRGQASRRWASLVRERPQQIGTAAAARLPAAMAILRVAPGRMGGTGDKISMPLPGASRPVVHEARHDGLGGPKFIPIHCKFGMAYAGCGDCLQHQARCGSHSSLGCRTVGLGPYLHKPRHELALRLGFRSDLTLSRP